MQSKQILSGGKQTHVFQLNIKVLTFLNGSIVNKEMINTFIHIIHTCVLILWNRNTVFYAQ